MSNRENMTGVTASHPCPVCEGNHKCSVGDQGLILCGRREGPQPGFKDLGPSNADTQFHLYRVADADDAPVKKATSNSSDWPALAQQYATQFTAETRHSLAERLGLPESTFDSVPLLGVVRVIAEGPIWTFPEWNATGQIIGLSRRFQDGTKKTIKGGKRGLTLVNGWREHAGPVLLVEGASDTLAMTAAGLCAIGRPSNLGGVGFLVKLLAEETRPVIVVGENDQQGESRWPGRDGAKQTADKLSGQLTCDVTWALPPEDAKDVRAWLVKQVATGVTWQQAGEQLLTHLTDQTQSNDDSPESVLPVIVVNVEQHKVNDQAIAALGSRPDLYQRGGVLTRVQTEPDSPERKVNRPLAVRIEPLPAATLREQFTAVARWVQPRVIQDRVEHIPTNPPDWCILAVMARGEWSGIRRLEAVVEYPVLLPSGEVLATPGFDPSTGLLYQPQVPAKITIADQPTLADVQQAIQLLDEVIFDFPLVSHAHRSAWYAALLTPLCRFAFSGPTPLFLVEGNNPGAGKGLMIHAISTILTGRPLPITTYTADCDELRKRITAIALEGELLTMFDNIDGPFGNAILDAALTSVSWKDRHLGHSKMIVAPLWTSWYASGNNVTLAGDMGRRVCPIRLETPEEKPEHRTDFLHPNLLQWVQEHRNELLSACLTILRGYFVAGRPIQTMASWGSFEGWSGLVRATLIWAGLPDPALTREIMYERADTEVDAMMVLMMNWHHIDVNNTGVTATQVVNWIAQCGQHPARESVQDAIDQLMVKPSGRQLGYKFRKYRRRILGGQFLDHSTEHKGDGTKWRVYDQSTFSISPKAQPINCPQPSSQTITQSQQSIWADSLGEIGEMLPPDPAVTADGRPIRDR